jgi:hypothetical protein
LKLLIHSRGSKRGLTTPEDEICRSNTSEAKLSLKNIIYTGSSGLVYWRARSKIEESPLLPFTPLSDVKQGCLLTSVDFRGRGLKG